MIKILLFLFLIPFFGLAQNLDGIIPGLLKNNSNDIQVHYPSKVLNFNKPIVIIDDVTYNNEILYSLNPTDIESIKVIKPNSKFASGAIEVVLIKDVNFNPVLLKDIVNEKVKLSSEIIFYKVDRNFIEDLDNYIINKYYIASITLEEINQNNQLVNIITVNTKNSNSNKPSSNSSIIIRG